MTLEEVGSWGGTMTDIGPLYPMAGSETLLVIIGVIFWVAWHVWQIRMENSNYADDLETLKKNGNMTRALQGEAILRPL